MIETTKTYGLVLAGGDSRRMGNDKARLERHGETQLQYAFSLLQSVTDRTFVSTRADQKDEAERSRYPQIIDQYSNIGPIAGILSALETHADVDWLVVACDLPNLDRETLEFLLAHRSGKKPFTAFRSSHDDLPEPLCAIYRAGSAHLLQDFISENVVCPRKVLIRSETELLQQPNPAALDNVNTPDDLDSSILRVAK